MAAHAIARTRAPQNRPEHLNLRRRMERAVERLLAALDAMDGDPDLEDGFDLEEACEDEGHDSDREPADYVLCPWPDGETDQRNIHARPWGC